MQYQYNVKQTNDENWEKYQLGDYRLIQYQILRTKIIINLWQTVRRITKDILGMKRLTVSPFQQINKVKYSDWPSLLEHKSWISHKIKRRNFQKNFHLPEIANNKTRKQVSFQNHHTLKNIQLQHWKWVFFLKRTCVKPNLPFDLTQFQPTLTTMNNQPDR